MSWDGVGGGKLILWDGVVATTIASGGHYWWTVTPAQVPFSEDGVAGFTADATNVPAAAWLPIMVQGAESIVLEWRGVVVAAGAAMGNCSACTVRAIAIGECDVIGSSGGTQALPALLRLATLPVASITNLGAGSLIYVGGRSTATPSGAVDNTYNMSVSVGDFPLLTDTTPPAIGDYCDGRLWLSGAQAVTAIAPLYPERLSQFKRVWVALKFIPTLVAGDTITILGTLTAHLQRGQR